MKRGLLFLLILGVVLQGAGWGCARKEKKTSESQPGGGSLDFKTLKEKGKDFTLQAKYPVVSNAAVNQAFEGFVKNEIAEFKKDMTPADLPGGGNNELAIDYTSYQFSNTLRSFKFEVMTYTGGAHPNTDIVTQTYDLNTGKEISLSDVFKPGSNYLNVVSPIAIDQLKAKIENTDLGWIKKGSAPVAENYGAFVLTEKEILFFFQNYQVAPYSEGPQEIKIPYTQIKEILQPPFGG